MEDDVIIMEFSTYKTPIALKQRIIANYLVAIEKERVMHQRILNDPNWASTGSDYHIKCRRK